MKIPERVFQRKTGLNIKTMKKLKSLLLLTGYILAFIACEYFLHYIQTKVEIGTAATVSLRAMEWMSAAGALIETAELVFGIEIKDKIKELFEAAWKKIFKNRLFQTKDVKNEN
jgi:hypothetical protein